MKSRVVAVAIALALLASACGSRAEDSNGSTNDLDSSSTTTAQGAGSSDSGMVGTIESPCGPGDASGATDTGVTDDSITVTSYSDSGGSIGGLNSGIDDTANAFVKWCNDQGGINGREIKLNFGSANLFEYSPIVTKACDDSLALVGGLAVFDDAGAQIQVDCGLVNVAGSVVSSLQSGADLTYAAYPQPPNEVLVGSATYLKEKYPEAISRSGYLSSDIASLNYISARMIEALEKIGFTFVYQDHPAIGETNWPAFSLAMQDADVDFVASASTWEEYLGLQKAMRQQGYEPSVTLLESNFYQPDYLEQADGLADGSYINLATWPFEEADQNPALTIYLDALEASDPGVAPQQIGVFAFSSWLLWATAVKSLGSDVTRVNLDKALSEIHEWTGGGLQGTSDPGNNKTSDCFISLQIQDNTFVRAFPTQENDKAIYDAGDGFACNPDYVVQLDTDYDNGAKAGQ